MMVDYYDPDPIIDKPSRSLIKALLMHRIMRVREAIGDRETPAGCLHNIDDCWYIDSKTDLARCHECDRKDS